MSAAAQASTSVASPALRSFEAQWQRREPDVLSVLRAEAMQRFLSQGLPTPCDESWRYTNLRRIAGTSFSDAPYHERGYIEPSASVSLLDGKQRAATVLDPNGNRVELIEDAA